MPRSNEAPGAPSAPQTGKQSLSIVLASQISNLERVEIQLEQLRFLLREGDATRVDAIVREMSSLGTSALELHVALESNLSASVASSSDSTGDLDFQTHRRLRPSEPAQATLDHLMSELRTMAMRVELLRQETLTLIQGLYTLNHHFLTEIQQIMSGESGYDADGEHPSAFSPQRLFDVSA